MRDDIPIAEGLDLWLTYNRRLLDVVDRETDVLWFDFDQPGSWMRAWLKRACQELDLRYCDEAADAFVDVERHQKASDLPAGELRNVYLELWHRAHSENVRHTTLPAANGHSHAAPVAAAGQTATFAALEGQINQMIEVLTKYNVVAQRQQRELELACAKKIDGNNVRLVASLMDRFGVAMHERVAWLNDQLTRLQQAEAGMVAKVDETADRLANDNEQLAEYLRQLVAAWEQQRWDRRLRRFVTRQFTRSRQPS